MKHYCDPAEREGCEHLAEVKRELEGMGLVKALRAELTATTERLAECSYRVIQLEWESLDLRAQLTAAREKNNELQGELDRLYHQLDSDLDDCGLTAAMKGE
jgi:predicted RNase H-like nuclease (RuvC/YqgF family)